MAGVNIMVDTISYEELKKDLKEYGKEAEKALWRSIKFTGLRMETIAKERLRGLYGSAKHWITGRLISSIHNEVKGNTSYSYKDDDGKVFSGDLGEPLNDMELVVGTNVIYAAKIEFEHDRFIGYAAEKGEVILEQRLEKELNKLA